MTRSLRRLEARALRLLNERGALLSRALLALVFAASALTALTAPRDSLRASPLDWMAQAASILSVGRVPFAASAHFVGAIEALAALALLFPSARLALIFLAARLALGLLPLVMFRDDLWRSFPTQLAGSGAAVLAHALLPAAALAIGLRARWDEISAHEDTGALLHETPQASALRRRAWRRAAITGVPILLIGTVAFRALWPKYLRWFHARQEAAALSEPLAGQLKKKSMPPSALLGGRKITTWVYLPPGYSRGSQRYPVVYVLHGMPGEVRDCFVKGQIQDAAEAMIKSGRIKPLILVGWDGQGPGGPTDVTNYLDRPGYPMESFVTRELLPYIDRTYRTIARPEARALDGVSAGGYAAPNLMLKYPNLFKIASSHNGFFSPRDDVENMTAILGPPGPAWDANDPTKLVLRRGPSDGLHFYGDIGDGDDLQEEFGRFGAELQSQGITHEMHIFPGRHTWEYWADHFHDSLLFADKYFREALAPRETTTPAAKVAGGGGAGWRWLRGLSEGSKGALRWRR